jgi:hypothetical protein
MRYTLFVICYIYHRFRPVQALFKILLCKNAEPLYLLDITEHIHPRTGQESALQKPGIPAVFTTTFMPIFFLFNSLQVVIF